MIALKIHMYALYDNLNILCRFDLGYEDMVQSFFSTIAYRLENNKWGSKYPTIMNEFYKGKLEQNKIESALEEIKDIKKQLEKLKVSQIIWDIDNLNKKSPFNLESNITLDKIFINSSGQKILDVIYDCLRTIKNKKIPLYIGEYYSEELEQPEIANIVNKTQNQEKNKKIIKYITYILIVLLIKVITNEDKFYEFIKLFIFSVLVSEIMYFHSNKVLKQKIKESQEKRKTKFFDISPRIRIEKITLKRDLRSSRFDHILDNINCPKTFDSIKKKLELKKITTWQLDLKEIHKHFGYDIGFAEDMINDLKQYKKLEFYELKNELEMIPKKYRNNIYIKENIYRILNTEDGLYLLIFKKWLH